MSNVYVYRTSPKTLEKDVGKVLNTADFQELNSEKETFIKINANYDRDWPGCNTSKWFLDALLRDLKDKGFNNLKVIEGDLKLQPAVRTIEVIGIKDLLEKHNVPFIPIEDLPRDEYELPLILHDSQLINTSVLHTHTFAVISCATKNLFGILPVYREKYHNILSEKLIELRGHIQDITCSFFSIIDGTVWLEGGSMRLGDPKRVDLILAGEDTLAVDKVASEIMWFSVEEVPLLKLAAEMGLVDLDSVKVDGDFSDDVPRYNFAYEESRIAQFDLWLRRSWLTRRFLEYNSFFDRLAQRARRRYTAYVYRKKKERVLEGDWGEYEKN
jgi:uncharacterized protein (DUF362 family)